MSRSQLIENIVIIVRNKVIYRTSLQGFRDVLELGGIA
jgi:hypothetical protein